MPVLTSPWYLRGACRTSKFDTDHWFHHNPTSPVSRQAKAVCRTCPVRETCLKEALSIPDTVGIWGGLDQYERLDIIFNTRRTSSSRT